MGPSGCGKTTVGSLVARLYDVDAPGRVTLDGRDVRSYPVAWLRERMAAVSQEPVLFAGTIADNIAYGKPVRARAVGFGRGGGGDATAAPVKRMDHGRPRP